MYRALLLFSLFLIATTASAQPDTARPLGIDGDFGPATLSIEYHQQRGDFRRATLSLASASKDGPAIPQGAIDQIGVLSKDGQWILIDRFLSSGQTASVQAQAMLPAPDAISMILMKPQRGPWRGWKVEELGGEYTEVEWTYFNQRGREVEAAPCASRACFSNVADASFTKCEGLGFCIEISGFSFGVERE